MTATAWCRNTYGLKHQRVITKVSDTPCGPLLDWVNKSGSSPSVWLQHRKDDWACWHREECTRCGKVLRRMLFRVDCPDAPQR